ncbi:Adenylate cyclase [Caenispirillum salinarum AK4]|uniref:Adenylate cyclase n=1 Tax=Caenispirillum salinarum AK4 TaxID=1238182 RepID=K9GZ42_9PROT|nr:CYTH and CHAD domain-containing protein [Caenispirillum salinarum]EKV30567.1 Adenylate cyclase [Caenispirillum salinarum AK4]
MVDDNTEIELKLEVAEPDLERLRRHPLLKETRKGRATSKTLKSVYYDTPDFLLFDGGASLRVRHSGKRRIQNVKARGGNGGAGLFSRKEWERDIDGDTPDTDAIMETGLADVFSRPGVLDELKPLFTTDFKRTEYTLGNGTWQVALTLDKGAVVTDTGSVPLCEVELELMHGDPAHLFEIARTLHEAAPMRLSTRSKSERGYALVGGLDRVPVKAPEAPVTADMSVAEAIQTICRSCQRHLLQNEAPLRELRDAEAVHQMRVALRRLRSALSVFKDVVGGPETEDLKVELKWLTGELGPARDTDVFIDEILGPVRSAHPDEDGLTALIGRFQRRNKDHYRKALAALDDRRYTGLMLQIGAWIEGGAWLRPQDPAMRDLLDTPCGGYAAKVLQGRHKKVLKRGKRFNELDAPQRHRLRVQIKKLRYASEFFGDVWGEKKVKGYVKALKALQDDLGDLNDIAVAHDLLHEIVGKDGAENREVWSAGLTAGWHDARQAALMDSARSAWKAFAGTDVFWPKPKKAAAKAEKAARQAARGR